MTKFQGWQQVSAEDFVRPEGRRLFWFLLREHAWAMMGVNCLTVLMCLPVVTAPAAIAACTEYCLHLIEDRPGRAWGIYWICTGRSCDFRCFRCSNGLDLWPVLSAAPGGFIHALQYIPSQQPACTALAKQCVPGRGLADLDGWLLCISDALPRTTSGQDGSFQQLSPVLP